MYLEDEGVEGVEFTEKKNNYNQWLQPVSTLLKGLVK